MNKLIPVLVGILVFAAIIFFKPWSGSDTPSSTPFPSDTVSPEASVLSPTPVNTQDIVATFLQHIAQKRVAEAVLMMSKNAAPDDASKQSWGVQFNAFKKLTVQSIEPSMEESWNDAQKTYRTTLDVEMDGDAAEAVIPYFGYANGTNTRWITIEKEGADWKIAGISTGP